MDEDYTEAVKAKHHRLLQGKAFKKASSPGLEKEEFDYFHEDLYFKYGLPNNTEPGETITFEHEFEELSPASEPEHLNSDVSQEIQNNPDTTEEVDNETPDEKHSKSLVSVHVSASKIEPEKSDSIVSEQIESGKSESVVSNWESIFENEKIEPVDEETYKEIDGCYDIKPVTNEKSKELEDAVDCLSKTFSQNCLSQVEYVRRLENVASCLAKSIRIGCCVSRPKIFKCLQTAIKALKKEEQKYFNKTKSNSTGTLEDEKEQKKIVETEDLINQCKELINLCNSLKRTACKMSKKANPREDFPICSSTPNVGCERPCENFRQKSNRKVNGKENVDGNRKKSSKLVKRKSIGNSNQDTRRGSRLEQKDSYRSSKGQSNDGFENNGYTGSPRHNSSHFSQEGRRRSSASTRGQNSIIEYEGDNQNTGVTSNASECIVVSPFRVALFVAFVMIFSISVLSTMVIVQF